MEFKVNLTNLANDTIANLTKILRMLQDENHRNNEAGDGIWILTSAFVIFTMQSGFGLLEAGMLNCLSHFFISYTLSIFIIFTCYLKFLFNHSTVLSKDRNISWNMQDFLIEHQNSEFNGMLNEVFHLSIILGCHKKKYKPKCLRQKIY